MTAPKIVDWEKIEGDYRAGVKTLREIAEERGITHGAINKRAKRDGWTRDLTAKIYNFHPAKYRRHICAMARLIISIHVINFGRKKTRRGHAWTGLIYLRVSIALYKLLYTLLPILCQLFNNRSFPKFFFWCLIFTNILFTNQVPIFFSI